MRVTFDAQNRQALADVNRAAERLLSYQRQVASGKRVERPSDDPSAAAAASVERASLANTDRYAAAAESSRSRLLVADTVLSDIVHQITSAQVTIVAARGTTATPAQREVRAQELEMLRDALLTDVNTSFRGTYLFGGAAATTRPYNRDNAGNVSAYQGSAVEVAVDIDTSVEVAVAFNGDALTRGGDPDDLFVVLDRAIDAARAGDTDALNTAAEDLKRAFDRATAMQSRVGASLTSIDAGALRLGDIARGGEARLTALEDANAAAAISGMAQAETVYRAALGAVSKLQQFSLMDYLR